MRRAKYDILVIGAGHGGIEASLAAARMGAETVLVTFSERKIAEMSCNPSIGGLAKGQIVLEIDALGGEMGKAIDATGIQFRTLNKRKGTAVQAPRAQADKTKYASYMRDILSGTRNLSLRFDEVTGLITDRNRIVGVRLSSGDEIKAEAVIVTAGTFLNGLIHIGDKKVNAGRLDDPCSSMLSGSLKELGFKLGRLKTGTPARLARESIDYSLTQIQPGDEPPVPFSFQTGSLAVDQVPCWLTYTTSQTHEIIRNNMKFSPLYSGEIVGIGPRYCPSIEDKVKKFADRDRHQIFLEPEGRDSDLIYPNGISTSLPLEVQERFIRSIPALKNAEIMLPGYAIEYDFIFPSQLRSTMESKPVENLFFAGQINGTSGYEEAAAQGLIAGINAVLKIGNKAPFIIGRDEAYIGVMLDDLVTRDIDEPYRMFTSRAEYRLMLRCDNADKRLMKYGAELGLLPEDVYLLSERKYQDVETLKKILEKEIVKESMLDSAERKEIFGERSPGGISLFVLLKRPEFGINLLLKRFNSDLLDKFTEDVRRNAEIVIKYDGYIKGQERSASKLAAIENRIIPERFDFSDLPGLSREAQEKLNRFKPSTLGQVARISGLTPAAIAAVNIALGKLNDRE